MVATLYYAHDPMCSWCWGFAPVWRELQGQLPEDIAVRYLLGGLAPDSAEPMTEAMRTYLQQTWRRIQAEIPGTAFNFAFWETCQPRRSTYPACRAVIAARQQDPAQERLMIRAIQEAYYLHALNPADDQTLVALAGELGLDRARFAADLRSTHTQALLADEIAKVQALGVQGFPSLMLEQGQERWAVPVDYTDAGAMLARIKGLLS